MTILLATDFDAAETAQWLTLLRAALPGETVVAARDDADLERVDIALVANPAPGTLRGLPRLALIHSLWAGVESLLGDPTVPTDVPIVRMADPAMAGAMAETALWAVLSLQRGFFDYAERQRAACWQQHGQRRADETAVAVLGLGHMGRAAAARLVANGYPVLGWSAGALPPQALGLAGVAHGAAALPGVLARADIVVNLLPLTPATRGLFDAARLAGMKRGASLVNLARGAHVVDADLLAALDAGQLRRAVLDVFTTEPLPSAHPYWRHPRVTVLPHAAALTDVRSAAAIAAANIAAFRAGRMPGPLVGRARGY